jgi:hypothetical protein
VVYRLLPNGLPVDRRSMRCAAEVAGWGAGDGAAEGWW